MSSQLRPGAGSNDGADKNVNYRGSRHSQKREERLGKASAADGGEQKTSRTNLNYAYPLREAQQTSGSARGTPPARPPRPQYVPPLHETAETEDEQYRAPAPSYPQQASRSSAEQDDPTSYGAHPSMHSERSIYIGFDPSSAPRSSTGSSTGIPDFPLAPSGSQRRSAGGPPPSSRRAPSSYYSQHTTMLVSPIPEESSSSRASRQGSYASSATIPPNWVPSHDYQQKTTWPRDQSGQLQPPQGEDETGLVRQASLGRKSKPTITQIKSPDRALQSRNRGITVSTDIPKGPSSSGRDEKFSPVSALTQDVNLQYGARIQSPLSARSSPSSPLAQPPAAVTKDDYFSEKPILKPKKSDTRLSLAMAKELSMSAGDSPIDNSPGSGRGSPLGVPTSRNGKRIPARLNIEAIRDAEARGSMSSLSDMIRRATKLAAVLETGRPGSIWGGRGSLPEALRSSSRSNERDPEFSDIIASFPPPVLGKNARQSRMSQWPLSGDYGRNSTMTLKPNKGGRRICGLPLWAFILLVLLALVVITAAVVVPLQLVNLSKRDAGDNDDQNFVARCRERNPCQNGGENIATRNFCGCICVNGFMGATCADMNPDPSCTSFNFDDRTFGGRTTEGIKNATIGSAIPRLFEKSEPAYNIDLDPSLLLGAFSKSNTTCTLQNALVSFGGRVEPTADLQKRSEEPRYLRRRQTNAGVTSTFSVTPTTSSASSLTTQTSTRELALDQDAVDFARVGVLYVAQIQSVDAAVRAQRELDKAFQAGTDFGDVSSGNVTFHLNERSIGLPDGNIVGGAKVNSTSRSGPAMLKRWVETRLSLYC